MRTTRKASTIVQFSPTAKSAKLIYDVRNVWPERLRNATTLLLMDVANYMVTELKRRAPEIFISGKKSDYAKDLRIGILESGEKRDVIAIYRGGVVSKMTEDSARGSVLYFIPKDGDPGWVRILMQYGPWPADIVPVHIPEGVKIISRRARTDETKALYERINSQRNRIESDLRSAGADSPKIGITKNSIGLSVHEDLGHGVLRKEFGLDGEKQESHWRPVFVDTKKYAEKCMEKVIKYVKSGDENVFDLPTETDRIGESVIKEGSGFSKEIAPFMK